MLDYSPMQYFKENYPSYLACLVISSLLGVGLLGLLPFNNVFTLSLVILTSLNHIRISKQGPDEESEAIITDLERLLAEQQEVLEQRDEILDEYEKIFDAQLVKLPCVCGGNTFEGLFSPNLDNVVECENCKNKYRVTIDYNSVLLSEPMDGTPQNFEQLIAEQQE